MNPSSLTMTVPPRSSDPTWVISAAGFIATRTLGWSPGVRMSRDAKWIWKAETPCGVPAGARISAGKSGSVARSFPATAVSSVKRLPTKLHPVAGVAGKAHDDAVLLLECLVAHPAAGASCSSVASWSAGQTIWRGEVAHPSQSRTSGEVEPRREDGVVLASGAVATARSPLG